MILLYGIHCTRACDDVSYYEFILTCGVIILYGEVPKDNRRDVSFTNSILIRGMVTGVIVLSVALFFTHVSFVHISLTILFALLTSLLFALVGLLN